MSSVTTISKTIGQPRGGYIPQRWFEKTAYDDGILIGEMTIPGSVRGMAVDGLTRVLLGTPVAEAFAFSVIGYRNRVLYRSEQRDDVEACDRRRKLDIDTLLSRITGLDDASVAAACKACGYNIWYYDPELAKTVRSASGIRPDEVTLDGVRTMVRRSVDFFTANGPVVSTGFTFEGAYTERITAGEGDFLTADTLWDMKAMSCRMNKHHTLQLLLYWMMGQRTGRPEFRSITHIGLYNPLLNESSRLAVRDIPDDVMEAVWHGILEYDLDNLPKIG